MSGVELLTVMFTAVEGGVFPAASRATAVRVWTLFEAAVVFQDTEYGAVVSSAPRLAPSNLNCTPATPTLSELEAESVTAPETVQPLAGGVPELEAMEELATLLMMGAALSTVALIAALVVVFPAASRATAVRLWGPFEANVEFQASEKGAEVSSAPRLTPSSLNCTPATARLSEAAADTVIV